MKPRRLHSALSASKDDLFSSAIVTHIIPYFGLERLVETIWPGCNPLRPACDNGPRKSGERENDVKTRDSPGGRPCFTRPASPKRGPNAANRHPPFRVHPRHPRTLSSLFRPRICTDCTDSPSPFRVHPRTLSRLFYPRICADCADSPSPFRVHPYHPRTLSRLFCPRIRTDCADSPSPFRVHPCHPRTAGGNSSRTNPLHPLHILHFLHG